MRTAYALALFLALTASAAAQSDSVTVNPMGGQMLYDPGTGQMRSVPPLLQPWQAKPIKLRPPHRRAPAPPPDASSQLSSTAPVDSAPPPPPVVRKPRPARVAATPPQTAPSGSLDSMDSLLSRQQITGAPKPVAKPTRTASIERPNATAGTRKDIITFAPGASDPSNAAVSAVRTLAGTLNAALSGSASRVQLLAYAGARGEKSSDTRRLSLKRALVVRQLLIDDGVPSDRIEVRAIGGSEDDGPLDRVDVYIKS